MYAYVVIATIFG